MHAELMKALAVPAVKERLTMLGMEPIPLTAAQFDAQVKGEIVTYAAFAKKAGLQAN